jgi:hypothetical protein
LETPAEPLHGVLELCRGGGVVLQPGEGRQRGPGTIQVRVVLLVGLGDAAREAVERPESLAGAGGGQPPDAVGIEGDLEQLDPGPLGGKTLGGEVGLDQRGLGPVDGLEAVSGRLLVVQTLSSTRQISASVQVRVPNFVFPWWVP